MFLVEWFDSLNRYLQSVVAELPAHSASPVDAGLFIFSKGGWIPLVAAALVTLFHLYVEYIEERWEHRQKYVLLAVDVPRTNEQSPKAVENIFASIWGGKSNPDFIEKYFKGVGKGKFSFEIVSNEGHLQYYIRCRNKVQDLVEASVYSQYPNAEIQEVEDYVKLIPTQWPNKEWTIGGCDIILKKDQIFPLKTYVEFEHTLSGELKDPLAAMIEMMNKIGPGEHLWFQICCVPDDTDWKKAAEKEIDKIAGKPVEDEHGLGWLVKILEFPMMIGGEVVQALFGEPGKIEAKKIVPRYQFTPVEKARMEGLTRKIDKLGFKSKARMFYVAKNEVAKPGVRVRMMTGAISGFSGSNQLVKYKPSAILSDYSWQKKLWSYYLSFGMYIPAPIRGFYLYHAYKNRSYTKKATPYILNTEELASLWHFPTIEIKSPLLKKIHSKRSEAPFNVPHRADFKTPPTAVGPMRSSVPDIEVHVEEAHEEAGHGGEGAESETPKNLPFA